MSRRKIKTRPKIKRPKALFTRDQWMNYRDRLAKGKRKKKVDTSPTMPEDNESKENEYTIPAPEKEASECSE